MTNKYLYWTPRILAILFNIFLAVFALDAFQEPNFWLAIAGFFIHLIPNYILAALTYIAWKYELLGGIFFILLGILFTIFFNTYREIISFLLISGPVFLIGILFLLNKHLRNKR